jgi:Beta-galactosidase
MLALLLVLAALPSDAIIVEAEDFEVLSDWVVGTTRADFAPGGLSGGRVLNSNLATAYARKTVTLPPGKYFAWVRVFDAGAYPGHYGARALLNGAETRIAATEPVYSTFVWELLGSVSGGTVKLALTDADSFNAGIDCFLFTQDENADLSAGTDLELISTNASHASRDFSTPLELALRVKEPVTAPLELTLAVARMTSDGLHRTIVWRDVVELPSLSWVEGAVVALPKMDLTSFATSWSHLRPGAFQLFVAFPNTSWATGQPVAALSKPESSVPAPCQAVVRDHRGAPAIWVNGKPESAFTYLIHAGDKAKHYGQMADIGVRFFTVPAPIGNMPGGFDPAGCDAPFLEVLKRQPNALIFPRVGVTPPAWWLEQHPEQRVVLDDGSTGPQSMFSELWLEDACGWIETYSRFIRTSPYADHVLGIHICSGVSAEWQSWGLWDEKRGDFSTPATEAWRAYLTKKYQTAEAMSEAWGSDVTFDTVAIPSRERRETESALLRSPGSFQDVMDFYDFYWRGTAKAIQALAAAAKRGGGRDWLVGFFYGYAIQYGGKMQESQHLGMGEVMDCPDIDFFCSPAMYSKRAPGGTSTFMSFTESIKMRGKFWWDEADNRTHLAKGRVHGQVTPAEDLWESLNVLEREYAHTVARESPIWWFDMAGGWYDDPDILALMGQMRAFGEQNNSTWEPEVQVAVFIDDKSSYRMAPESPYLHQMTQFLSELPRLGAPYNTYLLSDLPNAPSYRLYIFPLAFDLDDQEREAIEALQRDGNTLLFMGPAGVGRYRDGDVEHDEALSDALVQAPREGEGIQVAEHGAWRSAWCASPGVSMSELRELFTSARTDGTVHLYHDEDDALYAGNGFIALHAQTEGTKTLRFPGKVSVRELFADKPIQETTDTLTFPLKARETRCFAVDLPATRETDSLGE